MLPTHLKISVLQSVAAGLLRETHTKDQASRFPEKGCAVRVSQHKDVKTFYPIQLAQIIPDYTPSQTVFHTSV